MQPRSQLLNLGGEIFNLGRVLGLHVGPTPASKLVIKAIIPSSLFLQLFKRVLQKVVIVLDNGMSMASATGKWLTAVANFVFSWAA